MRDIYWLQKEIVFNRQQVMWLIPLLPILRDGEYPPDPRGSGYYDTPIMKKRSRRSAPFETSVAIAAELDQRLEQVGLDGLIVEFVYSADTADQVSLMSHIANMLGTDINDIERRCRRALSYISSGPDRRWHDTEKRKAVLYSEWIRHKRHK